MMLLLLLLPPCALAQIGVPATDDAAVFSATLRDLPFPETLAAAKALHVEALRRARRIERQHGHRRPAQVAIAVGPSTGVQGVLTSAAGSPIVPADFGADPTGAKDSTAAMQAAMAALLSRRDPSVSMASNITDQEG